MLRVLRAAIMEQGGDPEELARLRDAKEVLGRYRQLRASLGLSAGNTRDNYAVQVVSSKPRTQRDEVVRS